MTVRPAHTQHLYTWLNPIRTYTAIGHPNSSVAYTMPRNICLSSQCWQESQCSAGKKAIACMSILTQTDVYNEPSREPYCRHLAHIAEEGAGIAKAYAMLT